MDYCDVFISWLDSHSDGTHSLQRIHSLQYISPNLQNKLIYILDGLREGPFSNFIFGWTILLMLWLLLFCQLKEWSCCCSYTWPQVWVRPELFPLLVLQRFSHAETDSARGSMGGIPSTRHKSAPLKPCCAVWPTSGRVDRAGVRRITGVILQMFTGLLGRAQRPGHTRNICPLQAISI